MIPHDVIRLALIRFLWIYSVFFCSLEPHFASDIINFFILKFHGYFRNNADLMDIDMIKFIL